MVSSTSAESPSKAAEAQEASSPAPQSQQPACSGTVEERQYPGDERRKSEGERIVTTALQIDLERSPELLATAVRVLKLRQGLLHACLHAS